MRFDPPSTDAAAADDGLLCLTCEYNLSGLTEDRCPECGNPFDRAQLRLVGSGAPMPVRPWDDRTEIGVLKAFWRTCVATWMHPAEFARTFPAGHSVKSAWAFSGICYAIAAILVVVSPASQGAPAGMALMMLVGIVLSAVGCEELLAIVLALLVPPRRVCRAFHRHFWRGLMHYSGNYLIFSALMIATPSLLNVLLRAFGKSHFLGGLYGVLPLISILYWWAAMARLVGARVQRRNAGFVIAVLLIPVAGILSYFVCILLVMWFASNLT